MWGLNTLQPHFTLEGHEKGVNCVEYFSGGDRPYLVSGADDKTVKARPARPAAPPHRRTAAQPHSRTAAPPHRATAPHRRLRAAPSAPHARPPPARASARPHSTVALHGRPPRHCRNSLTN